MFALLHAFASLYLTRFIDEPPFCRHFPDIIHELNSINYHLYLTLRCPRYFANRKRPRGGVPPLWIFAFPSEFCLNISDGYVFGVKESNGDNEKILSILRDFENQGQIPFCMTFHISGCKHDTNSILVVESNIFEVKDIENVIKNHVTLTCHVTLMCMTLELKVIHIHCMAFFSSGCIHAAELIFVSILTFTMPTISENSKSLI